MDEEQLSLKSILSPFLRLGRCVLPFHRKNRQSYMELLEVYRSISAAFHQVDFGRKYCGAFFTESGRLYEEPSNLLKQELRDPSTYNSVIGAIAGGASKMNEIATKAGIETGAASNLLQALIELGIRPKGSSHYGKRNPAGKQFIYWRIRCSVFGIAL